VLARLAADLIDRGQAEVTLRESEERFRTMADAAPVMIWLSGTDGLCTWFNQRWLAFVGRTMEQEVGDGWAENVHPADLERCVQTYTSSFDARESFHMEYRLRRHDGEWRWVLDNGIPRTGPDSKFAGFIGSCIDISERKAVEAELEAKDEELRRVTSTTPLVLTRCGRDLRYRFVNRAAAALFGLTPEEMVGRPIVEIMGEESFAVIRPHIERVLAGEPVEYEARSAIPRPACAGCASTTSPSSTAAAR
jgi:PAS domain S-box-containing protein